MNRDPYLPLTETAYYTLVALLEPCHGYKILNKVKELSDGQVHLAPGTLYGALENLEKQGLINLIEEVGPRKKVFQIAEKGREVLEKERLRLIHMTNLLGEEKRLLLSREKTAGKEKIHPDEALGNKEAKNQKEKPEENNARSKQANRNKINKRNKEEDLFY